jgi:hypothetical protein
MEVASRGCHSIDCLTQSIGLLIESVTQSRSINPRPLISYHITLDAQCLPCPLNNQPMLNLVHALLELLKTLALPELNLFCNNCLPCIDLCNNLMDHNTRALQPLFLPRLPRSLNRARARKLARQRRMQVDDPNPRRRNRVQKLRRHNVHPARADNERGSRRQPEDNGREFAIVFSARCGGALEGLRVCFLVRDKVVVGCGDRGVGGALKAVGGFAAARG